FPPCVCCWCFADTILATTFKLYRNKYFIFIQLCGLSPIYVAAQEPGRNSVCVCVCVCVCGCVVVLCVCVCVCVCVCCCVCVFVCHLCGFFILSPPTSMTVNTSTAATS